MGSDVFTAVTVRIVSVWIMTPCKLINGYQNFEGIFCFNFHPEKEAENFSKALVITPDFLFHNLKETVPWL